MVEFFKKRQMEKKGTKRKCEKLKNRKVVHSVKNLPNCTKKKVI